MGLCDLLRNGTKCRFHYLKITQGKNDFFLNLILKNVYIFLWFGNSKTPDNNSVENIHKKKKPNKNWAEQWLQYFLRNINKEENERFRQSKFSLTEIIVYFDFKQFFFQMCLHVMKIVILTSFNGVKESIRWCSTWPWYRFCKQLYSTIIMFIKENPKLKKPIFHLAVEYMMLNRNTKPTQLPIA